MHGPLIMPVVCKQYVHILETNAIINAIDDMHKAALCFGKIASVNGEAKSWITFSDSPADPVIPIEITDEMTNAV